MAQAPTRSGSSNQSVAVSVDSLVKTFGGTVRALDGVSFEIPTGTVLGLLGPNGAGKTTAVRVLTTLLRPDSGSARVAGVDVLADPEAARRVIGLAGQYAAVDEALTGAENLRLVGSLNHLGRAERRQRSEELLEQFGLSDAADRTLKTYSGGMRRRLDLAAALVARPPVLFLDEPTTGLDPRSRIDLWAVIGQLVADGTTLLLTTQYLEEADRLADQICVIDHGKVIAEGTAAELKAKLGGTVVEVTLSNSDDAITAEQALKGAGEGAPTREGEVVRVATSAGPATLTEVVRRLDAAELEPTGLQLRQPSLDDVFLSLTGHGTSADDEMPRPKRGRRKAKDVS
ncbi:MAG: type transport system ATP-binding protein [Pseudonocardiales bacterium]|jgi:ABC-2 type transport system ATP-binding protein|nr:transporter ATP-binding protein [Frankiales bacterium]MDQ1736217.1 type transport system ATP-binding protein [Pseudonocardiales bacterium]